MIFAVPDAVSRSLLMGTSTENTAPMIATSRLGSKVVTAMSEQEFDREKRYQAAMQIADALLKRGSVSEEEYHQIKTKLLEKYRPTLSTLMFMSFLLSARGCLAVLPFGNTQYHRSTNTSSGFFQKSEN